MEYGVLTGRMIARWSAALLGSVLLASALVGWASEGWGGFNWDVACVFGTALGTTALAAFTGALAFTTSGDVRATWELAQLTQADQERREEPLVILFSGPDFNGSADAGNVEIVLFNAGLGP